MEILASEASAPIVKSESQTTEPPLNMPSGNVAAVTDFCTCPGCPHRQKVMNFDLMF